MSTNEKTTSSIVYGAFRHLVSRRVLLGGLAVAAAACGRLAGRISRGTSPTRVSHVSHFGADYFPNVTLLTHEGKKVRFYDDLLKGKTVVINFIYAQCERSCPRTTANLVTVQQALGGRVGRELFMYSITLNPEHDTPEELRRYAEAHGVGPGWTFLTGKPGDIELLRQRLGFTDPDPVVDAERSNHVGIVRVGNEPRRRWQMCAALGSPRQIVREIDELVRSL
jgi:protein SCO1/2